MSDCYFSGGPLDGQWIDVDDGISTFIADETEPNRRLPNLHPPGTAPALVYNRPRGRVYYIRHRIVEENVEVGSLFTLNVTLDGDELKIFNDALTQRQLALAEEKLAEEQANYNSTEYQVAADYLEDAGFVGPATALRQLAMGRLVRGCESLTKEEQAHVAHKLLTNSNVLARSAKDGK